MGVAAGVVREGIEDPVLAPTHPQREPGRLLAGAAGYVTELLRLVFVVAMSRINEILAGDQSRAGVLWFLGVFVVVTWSWSNFVMSAERFDTDDVVHRLAKAAAMFAVAAMRSGGGAGLITVRQVPATAARESNL